MMRRIFQSAFAHPCRRSPILLEGPKRRTQRNHRHKGDNRANYGRLAARNPREAARLDSTMLVVLGPGYDGLLLRVVQIKMARAICFAADPVGPLAALCALVTA